MLASVRSLRRLSSSSSSSSLSPASLRRLLLLLHRPPPPPPPPRPPLPPFQTLARGLLPRIAARPVPRRFSTASCSSTLFRVGECGAPGATAIPEAERGEEEEREGEDGGEADAAVEVAAGRHDTDAYAAVELALDSVVKVFTVSSSPNYFLPWQNKAQRESMGSGKLSKSQAVSSESPE